MLGANTMATRGARRRPASAFCASVKTRRAYDHPHAQLGTDGGMRQRALRAREVDQRVGVLQARAQGRR